MTRRAVKPSYSVSSSEVNRDVHGFTVYPHHLQLYKEYAVIYKEEEAERSVKWGNFLRTYGEFVPLSEKDASVHSESVTIAGEWKAHTFNEVVGNADEDESSKAGFRRFEAWEHVRPSLWPVERALCFRFKKRRDAATSGLFGATSQSGAEGEPFKAASPSRYTTEGSEDESDEVFYDVERSDLVQDGTHSSSDVSSEGPIGAEQEEESCPWKEELDALVQGGVPMALRGELWQVFVGAGIRRVQGHYQELLTLLAGGGGDRDGIGSVLSGTTTNQSLSESDDLEKSTAQIEKDLPRTFPGHPALDEAGRNALYHLLRAYAGHNPEVGYCQAMNFLAALPLMMMPEENAFWTLDALIDDYFKGYYSEQMVESQVDQLVLEELVRMHFPRLVTHLDALGVNVTWVSGPWFLSIFINILPWESVLRVWDMLLYEGNRSMLFRTALSLLELHGSAIMATKDAGDAMTILQSLAGGTFDSSQLVLIACMGYRSIDESKLQELRLKHRPQVLAAFSKCSVKQSFWSNTNVSNLSKLYNHDISINAFNSQQSGRVESRTAKGRSFPGVASDQVFCNDALPVNGKISNSSACEEIHFSLKEHLDATRVTDLVEQVRWLKLDLSRVLEERRVATLRAEEVEIAFMELVKEDNGRLLSAKVETLKAEGVQLRQALADKEEQERVMIQVMLRTEHEQQSTEAARRFAEDNSAAQRHAGQVLKAKYEDAVISLTDMEKRAVKAETMLKATLQCQTLDNNHGSFSQRFIDPASACEEEPSRWSWSRILSKSADSDGSIGSLFSTKLNGGDHTSEQLNIKNTESQLDVPPQRQGLLSRRFSLSWHEKLKGNSATPSEEGLKHHSGFSSTSLSRQ